MAPSVDALCDIEDCDEKPTHTCSCKRTVCERHMIYGADPYAQDILDNDTPISQCKVCYGNSMDDI